METSEEKTPERPHYVLDIHGSKMGQKAKPIEPVATEPPAETKKKEDSTNG